MSADPQTARPFVKSVGGKTRLLPELISRLPSNIANMRYCETFAGGGALYFAIEDHLRRAPRGPLLGDANAALINAYLAVRDDVEELVLQLSELQAAHAELGAECYATAREAFNAGDCRKIEHAALFIYLNKTCFNGLFRVNKSGAFNVPMGSYDNPSICDAEGLRAASAALQGADILWAEYRTCLYNLLSGDDNFVFFDPPYVPVADGSFTAYTPEGFGETAQRGLSQTFRELDAAGCKLMLSNSPAAAALYDGYHIETVRAPRSVNSKGGGRGLVDEIVVRNY
jgi:DNA adenine methylase